MMVARLYAGDDGESHFDTQEIAMTLQDFAPAAAPLYVSEALPASRFVVIQLPVAWGGSKPPVSVYRISKTTDDDLGSGATNKPKVCGNSGW